MKLTWRIQHVTSLVIQRCAKSNYEYKMLPLSGFNFLSFLALNLAFDSRLYLWKKSLPFLSGECLSG